MAVLPVIIIGHPGLRKVADPVEKFDDELKNLAENMIETMRVNEGIGLAATQVNVMKRLFVIDRKLLDERLPAQAYVNPEILESEISDKREEGCLSIPGIRADVERSLKVKARYQTLDGEEVEEELEGLLARVFQHEYDHLQGILFIDRLTPLKRKLLQSKINDLKGVYANS